MLCPVSVIPGIDSLEQLYEPLAHLPWTSWRALWLGNTLQGRNAVLIFLPLLPLLRLLPVRYLRAGIILTGLLFVAYVFGVAYLALWLAMCWAFYLLSERFAVEVKRTDVVPWGPPLAAILIIIAQFALIHLIDDIRLSAATNTWLLTHLPWLFPLGARGLSWEPGWFGTGRQLFAVMLDNTHDVGAAYLTMRMVHYFSEIKRGTIRPEQRSLSRFFAYVCYAPTLIQGPIERYSEFNAELESCRQRRGARDLLAGLGRILIGLIKIVFALAYLIPWMDGLGYFDPQFYQHPYQTPSYLRLFFTIHLVVILLYLLFSAYCDVAIGMSRLLGIRIAENFHRFWLARSLTDMWRRWHITLSFILRDYIFFPLTRRRWNSLLALGLTFGICGAWHSLEPGYLMWGVVMGLMVAVNQRWTRWMRDLDRHPQRRLSRVRRAWLKFQPLPKLCAWLLTINVFFMSGWICFWGLTGFRVLWELLRRPVGWLAGG